jgi:glycerophosphoryl diester phosphodiesterase
MKRYLLISLLFSLFSFGSFAQKYSQPHTVKELQQILHYSPQSKPLISAHRGGPVTGFPENCIETFENTLRYVPVLIECDVQLTKDSNLVMMHDNSLDRTSNGTGKIIEKSLKELNGIKLKDNEGKQTDFSMPIFDEVLKWAKNKAILTVDIKRDIPPELVVKHIQQHKAQPYAIVITYSLETAKKYYQLDNTLCFSVTLRNMSDIERFDNSGIPASQVFAFVGVSEADKSIYEALHKRGIKCMVGTMGNLDKKHQARQSNVYAAIVENGADMLSTDFAQECYKALTELK